MLNVNKNENFSEVLVFQIKWIELNNELQMIWVSSPCSSFIANILAFGTNCFQFLSEIIILHMYFMRMTSTLIKRRNAVHIYFRQQYNFLM